MKLFCAYPEDYIAQAAASGVRGLLFHDITLRNKGIKIKTLLSTWPRFTPKPAIAVVFEDSVELDKKRYPIYHYEQSQSEFIDLLEAGETLIFCAGYSSLMQKNASAAKRWVSWMCREAKVRGAGIHLMGVFSLNALLKYELESADVTFKIHGDQKTVFLPNGKRILPATIGHGGGGHAKWLRAMGFSSGMVLETPHDIIEFNIRSYLYSLENFRNNPNFELPKGESPNPAGTPENLVPGTVMEKAHEEVAKRRQGLVCGQCTVKRCDARQDGAICSKEDSAFHSLIEHFQSRDANYIIDGLQYVLSEQAERFMDARAGEKRDEVLDKDVTQLGSALIKDGMALVKLLRPDLAPSPQMFFNNPKIIMAIEQERGLGAGTPALVESTDSSS